MIITRIDCTDSRPFVRLLARMTRVEEDTDTPILAGLADADLLGLRLAAQVMAHKAELERRAPVAGYFGRLEHAVQAELASRLTGIRTQVGSPTVALEPGADDGDRRLVAEYLGLLVANQQLTAELREACRRLRARTLS